jgi:hypothetical protein
VETAERRVQRLQKDAFRVWLVIEERNHSDRLLERGWYRGAVSEGLHGRCAGAMRDLSLSFSSDTAPLQFKASLVREPTEAETVCLRATVKLSPRHIGERGENHFQ